MKFMKKSLSVFITLSVIKATKSTTCKTFTHPGNAPSDKFNCWATDGSGNLNSFCESDEGDCCRGGGAVPNPNCGSAVCNDVNNAYLCYPFLPGISYTLCTGACKGYAACFFLGNGGGTWPGSGTVTVQANACVGESACSRLGQGETGVVDIVIEANSCTTDNACNGIGQSTDTLTSITVPSGECNELGTPCRDCGKDSTFPGAFLATSSCCANGGSYDSSTTDETCTNSESPSLSSSPSNLPSLTPSSLPSSSPSDSPSLTPSSLPSSSPSDLPSLSSSPSASLQSPQETNPCRNINCSNRGKCQIISSSEAECKCENTFIQSENKLDCICPATYEFDTAANRCFRPDTSAPTKSPIASPTLTPTASPSQTTTKEDDEDPYVDDDNYSFTLDNGNTGNCKWIQKNRKRRARRKAKYCTRQQVMKMCPVSCDKCSS